MQERDDSEVTVEAGDTKQLEELRHQRAKLDNENTFSREKRVNLKNIVGYLI